MVQQHWDGSSSSGLLRLLLRVLEAAVDAYPVGYFSASSSGTSCWYSHCATCFGIWQSSHRGMAAALFGTAAALVGTAAALFGSSLGCFPRLLGHGNW